MSSKRRADKYLTDQNWDQEDEKQEKGHFETASEDVIRTRTIKRAHRRSNKLTTNSAPFAGFTGFAGLSSTKPVGYASSGPNAFNLQAATSNATSLSSGSASASRSFANANQSSKNNGNVRETSQEDTSAEESKRDLSSDEGSSSSQLSDYNRHVAALNKSVSRWISEHVEKNSMCDLTPVFNDYSEHLLNIEEKYGESSSQPDISRSSPKGFSSRSGSSNRTPSPKPSSQASTPPKAIRATTPPKNPLGSTFTSQSNTTPFKGFGSAVTTSSAGGVFKGFQFNTAMVSTAIAPSAASSSKAKEIFRRMKQEHRASNSNVAQGQRSQKAVEAEAAEEEYTPPQPETTVVKEKDAFYTIKCKLFYMKEGAYADKGVGHLHLKTLPSSAKTQLIVRADTSLGNILLNIMLSPAMPIKKQGKNNISFTCVPNPPIDEDDPTKVYSMLVRVKTSDDADGLLDILEEKKKLADE